MGLDDLPEVKYARRIIRDHSLKLPIDVEALVRKFAKLKFESIPVQGIDGVSINLKLPNKEARIIVNSDISPRRKRFTLAHELGHLVIPWHIGTIVDEIKDESGNYFERNQAYWEIEREANRFAAELLMPTEHVCNLYLSNHDANETIASICKTCDVSEEAASVRLSQLFPKIEKIILSDEVFFNIYKNFPDLGDLQRALIENLNLTPTFAAKRMIEILSGKVIYCQERDGIVVSSACTRNTYSRLQYSGEQFIGPTYYETKYHTLHLEDGNFHWWSLSDKILIDDSLDNRSWREILDKIAQDISPVEGISKFKMSINGQLSGAHGSLKHKNRYNGIDELITALIHRLDHTSNNALVKHPDFRLFIKKRALDFINK